MSEAHWEKIYQATAAEQVSWYRPHLEMSLAMIERAGAARSAAILDVGGGESTLVDDLLERGYRNVSVLDISPTAIAATKRRLKPRAERVRWIAADITAAELAPAAYDIWHDRAVFHFFTAPWQRQAYLSRLRQWLRPGGQAIIAGFGPAGPTRCSGLAVERYGTASLLDQLGAGFRLLESAEELHETPAGAMQQFLYCRVRLD